MASYIYNQFKTDVLAKLVSCTTGGDSFKIALYTAQLAVTAAAYSSSGEVATGSGYTQSGVAITSQSLSGTGTVSWLANSVSWTSSGTGFSAAYCTIYDTTNANHTICSFDFAGTQTASGGGTFTISFNNTSPGAIFYLA